MGRDASPDRPNILLLFTDQQRADTIGAHGNPLIRTPVLDRLAREGVSFVRAYTPSPVCVAARHALLTGMAPHRTGVVDNVERAPAATSIMEVLAGRGYQTHGAGKMHFCGDPRRRWGFESRDYSEELDESDDYRAFLVQAGYGYVCDPHGVRSEYYYLPQPSQLPERLHHTSWVADRSIEFLRRRDRSRPFFLWSSFIKPHPPFETPNPWNRLYRSVDMEDPLPGDDSHHTFWNRLQNRYKYMDGGMNPHLSRTQRAAYYSAISFIDFNIGRILDALGPDQDNTLIVFSSDHGELLGDFGCYGKRAMLEGAVRVPLLVRQPGVFAAGEQCRTPVTLLDLFPTFAAAAGAREPTPENDAADLARVAHDPGGMDRRVTSQFSQRSLGLYMITDARWKYIFSAADRREWLFDLANDPGELMDLSAAPAADEPLHRLRSELIGRFEREGYSWAVSDGRWRDYGTVQLPDDPREGVLFQDPATLEPALAALGDYAPRRGCNHVDWLAATLPGAMDPLTGRIRWPEPWGGSGSTLQGHEPSQGQDLTSRNGMAS